MFQINNGVKCIASDLFHNGSDLNLGSIESLSMVKLIAAIISIPVDY